MNGLTPAELFFTQSSGREGLIDTALNTSESGSIHHYIIKAMEDVLIELDGSVRNVYRTIYQFSYGYDGLDPSHLVKVPIGETKSLSFINMRSEVEKLNAKYANYKV